MLCGLLVLAMAACRGPPATPEEEIRTLIAAAVEAVESGDIGAVAHMLHPDYRDVRGNDRDTVLRLLRFQLLRGGRVLVIPDIRRVEVHADSAASVSMTLRFAEADLGRLSVDAGVRRAELDLVREDAWQVISARWSRPDAAPR